MDAIKDLAANETAIFGALLIAASTVFVILGKATVDQWIGLAQWIFTAYASATAAHKVSIALAKKPVVVAAVPPA